MNCGSGKVSLLLLVQSEAWLVGASSRTFSKLLVSQFCVGAFIVNTRFTSIFPLTKSAKCAYLGGYRTMWRGLSAL